MLSSRASSPAPRSTTPSTGGSSRHERVLLVFSVQCALYTVFCLAISAFFRARTIPDAQATLDRFVTLGVILHVLLLQVYADLGGRHDRAFRGVR